MMKRYFYFILLLALSLASSAQDKSMEQMGGVYYLLKTPGLTKFMSGLPFADDTHSAIPYSNVSSHTPKGYKLFYLSHYGRHGARWMTTADNYEWLRKQLSDTTNLTPKGLSLRHRMDIIYENAHGFAGQLTPLGYFQQQELGEWAYLHYPTLFSGRQKIDAMSSVIVRCPQTMRSFCYRLWYHNPHLSIRMRVDTADMRFMAFDSPQLKKLYQQPYPFNVSHSRFIASLFKDTTRVSDKQQLFNMLYTLSSDMQDLPELGISLYDLFTKEEYEALYNHECERMYFADGFSPANGGVTAQCGAHLWEHIVNEADKAINGNGVSATLRFGHDTQLYHLLALLRLSIVGKPQPWIALDEILPMGANLHLIFFRNDKGNVVVQFMLNHQPAELQGMKPVSVDGGFPTYSWRQVKSAYQHFIDRQKELDK